jgi:hypothetical protein
MEALLPSADSSVFIIFAFKNKAIKNNYIANEGDRFIHSETDFMLLKLKHGFSNLCFWL